MAIANAHDTVLRMTLDSQMRTSKEINLMVLLPSLLVGKVIGFRGMCVHRMRAETNAKFICLDRLQHEPNASGDPDIRSHGYPDDEKVVLFRGNFCCCAADLNAKLASLSARVFELRCYHKFCHGFNS